MKVSSTELAMIQGFNSIYDSGFDKDKTRVGKYVDIAKIVKTAAFIRTVNTDYLRKITANLDRAKDEINEAIEMSDELNCFETLK